MVQRLGDSCVELDMVGRGGRSPWNNCPGSPTLRGDTEPRPEAVLLPHTVHKASSIADV